MARQRKPLPPLTPINSSLDWVRSHLTDRTKENLAAAEQELISLKREALRSGRGYRLREVERQIRHTEMEIDRCKRELGDEAGKPTRGAIRQRYRMAAVKEYKDRRAKAGERGCESCGMMPPDYLIDEAHDSIIQVHHVVPVARGGGDEDSNLVAICANCHRIAHWWANRPTPPKTRDELLLLMHTS